MNETATTNAQSEGWPALSRRRWKLVGLAATLVIVLAFPLYLVKQQNWPAAGRGTEQFASAGFVGRESCRPCHKAQCDAWDGSHHDLAMDRATDETVLADFNDTEFTKDGATSRFYRRDGRFFIETTGPDGQPGEFEVTHTFGAYPLQQYLVPFPGGRLQCLTIAWDSKDGQWFHLYPDADHQPGDWLHWTGYGMNWNLMCSECHSTNLKKGFDPETNSYNTTWSEIDVSCEACHGPGSLHLRWAELPAMARPPSENYELVVRTGGIGPKEQVELCAPCHSRRAFIDDYAHARESLLDSQVPQLLSEGMYFPDGQILEEVYVYGSFIQSKMYDSDVRCGDCHDVHSLKLHKEGNGVCLQCHRAEVYDTGTHHFHKKIHEGKESEGALCARCHMPGRIYMGNDYRLDHSLRVPRPDLSVALGVPNACNQVGCHTDKDANWSERYMTEWYGTSRKPHYGTAIAAGRDRLPEAEAGLIGLLGDALSPVMVRATAASLLGSYYGSASGQALEQALDDEEALIRHSAIIALERRDLQQNVRLITPLLYDPVRAVRMEAARTLAGVPPAQLQPPAIMPVFEGALEEYIAAGLYAADFPEGRYNLGNLYANMDRATEAESQYLDAIRIDSTFYPAQVNLAMLYNQLGRNDEAADLLRQALVTEPDAPLVDYNLGLLLAEMEQFTEAAGHLERAADGMPGHTRVLYNLGLVEQRLGRMERAAAAIDRALALEPENGEFLYTAAWLASLQQDYDKAEGFARRMTAQPATRAQGQQLLEAIAQARQQRGPGPSR